MGWAEGWWTQAVPGLGEFVPCHNITAVLWPSKWMFFVAGEEASVFKCSVSRETECSRVGKQSFILTLGCNSVLLQFSSPSGNPLLICWPTHTGPKEKKKKRKREICGIRMYMCDHTAMQAAMLGVIAVIWTLEQSTFNVKLCNLTLTALQTDALTTMRNGGSR